MVQRIARSFSKDRQADILLLLYKDKGNQTIALFENYYSILATLFLMQQDCAIFFTQKGNPTFLLSRENFGNLLRNESLSNINEQLIIRIATKRQILKKKNQRVVVVISS